jgi:hypothetical protein
MAGDSDGSRSYGVACTYILVRACRATPARHCSLARPQRRAHAAQIRKGVPVYDHADMVRTLGLKAMTWPQKCVSAAWLEGAFLMVTARAHGFRAFLGERIPFIHQSNPSNDWWVFHHSELSKEIGFGPAALGKSARVYAQCGLPVNALRAHVSGAATSGPRVKGAKTINEARTVYNIKTPGYTDLFKAGPPRRSARVGQRAETRACAARS